MEHVREDWAEQSRTAMLEEAQTGDSPENTQPAAQEGNENDSPVTPPPPPGVDAEADAGVGAEDGPRGRSSWSSNPSQLNPEPGFAHIDGDVGGSGYNETTNAMGDEEQWSRWSLISGKQRRLAMYTHTHAHTHTKWRVVCIR